MKNMRNQMNMVWNGRGAELSFVVPTNFDSEGIVGELRCVSSI
jgi:hypothetical protein